MLRPYGGDDDNGVKDDDDYEEEEEGDDVNYDFKNNVSEKKTYSTYNEYD